MKLDKRCLNQRKHNKNRNEKSMGFYNRDKMSELSSTPFAFGVYPVVISDLRDETSPKGFNQFKITVKGKNGEQGLVTFTFGTKYSDEGMTRLLASIEDAGTPIPDLAFDYSAETADFLLDKALFIWVRENLYLDDQGKERKSKKIEFITQAEFESLGGRTASIDHPEPYFEEQPFPEEPLPHQGW